MSRGWPRLEAALSLIWRWRGVLEGRWPAVSHMGSRRQPRSHVPWPSHRGRWPWCRGQRRWCSRAARGSTIPSPCCTCRGPGCVRQAPWSSRLTPPSSDPSASRGRRGASGPRPGLAAAAVPRPRP
eukprot:scaffold61753_cov57-Phaeocystis_antarctica.AAC.4